MFKGCCWLEVAKQPGAGLDASSKLGLLVYSPECAGFGVWLQTCSVVGAASHLLQDGHNAASNLIVAPCASQWDVSTRAVYLLIRANARLFSRHS